MKAAEPGEGTAAVFAQLFAAGLRQRLIPARYAGRGTVTARLAAARTSLSDEDPDADEAEHRGAEHIERPARVLLVAFVPEPGRGGAETEVAGHQRSTKPSSTAKLISAAAIKAG